MHFFYICTYWQLNCWKKMKLPPTDFFIAIFLCNCILQWKNIYILMHKINCRTVIVVLTAGVQFFIVNCYVKNGIYTIYNIFFSGKVTLWFLWWRQKNKIVMKFLVECFIVYRRKKFSLVNWVVWKRKNYGLHKWHEYQENDIACMDDVHNCYKIGGNSVFIQFISNGLFRC